MMRIVLVLMLLLATLDALPVQAFPAAWARKPAPTCCCKGVCRCRHCTTDHRHAAKASPGTSVLDCAGCRRPVPHGVTIPPASIYVLPSLGSMFACIGAGRVSHLPVAAPASSPRRLPDPPPRHSAA